MSKSDIKKASANQWNSSKKMGTAEHSDRRKKTSIKPVTNWNAPPHPVHK